MTRNIRVGLGLSAALLTGWLTTNAASGQTPTVTREERAIGDRVGASYGVLEGGVRVANATVAQIKPIEQVVLVLDGSGSMTPVYARIVEELRKALPARPAVPTAIVRFSAQKSVLQDFTSSRAALDEALAKEQNLWAGGGVNDGTMKSTTDIYGTLSNLAAMTQGKLTHFIIITDGNDSLQQLVDLPRIATEEMVVSYLNWGYRSFSARVDEANAVVVTGGGARRMDIPNVTLRFLAERTGGDVLNYDDWRQLNAYIKRRLSNAGALYRATWESNNPLVPFSLSAR